MHIKISFIPTQMCLEYARQNADDAYVQYIPECLQCIEHCKTNEEVIVGK